MHATKTNFAADTVNRSKERVVKMSPSQFGKEKDDAVKKLLFKGNLRMNPINLSSKKS